MEVDVVMVLVLPGCLWVHLGVVWVFGGTSGCCLGVCGCIWVLSGCFWVHLGVVWVFLGASGCCLGVCGCILVLSGCCLGVGVSGCCLGVGGAALTGQQVVNIDQFFVE